MHTPPKKITTCEILPFGKYVVLALENEPNLVTLELKNFNDSNQQTDSADTDETTKFTYGDEDLDGKTFQL